MTKDEAHDIAFDAWLATGVQDGVFVKDIKAAYIGGTGTGKSKVGSSATEYVCHYLKNLGQSTFEPKILILAHSTRLRDYGWRDEFQKWGTIYLWDYVTTACYQAAYKWENTHWDLVIADEGDFALTDEYIKFFQNNTFDNILFLTATLTPDKRKMLAEICPICHEYSTVDAQQDGVLNQSSFTIVEFDLNRRDKDIAVEYKKGGKKYVFHQTENEKYQYLEERCEKALMQLQIAQQKLSKLEFLQNKAKTASERHKYVQDIADALELVKNKQITFYRSASARKEFLHSLKSARTAAKLLVQAVLNKDESNKILVFSKTTAQIDKILKYTYHSANSSDNPNIDLFNKGDIRYLGVCDALNRGENLVGVNHILKESYVGSTTEFQQQHGRGTRLEVSDTMRFIILIPVWHRKIVNEDKSISWNREYTQAKKWANEMTRDFDLSNSKHFKLNM
jgi:superfamily II DNA or RNA helicase